MQWDQCWIGFHFAVGLVLMEGMKAVLLLAVMLALSGCGGNDAEFERYVGPAVVTKGTGGTVETFGGVDFWQDGTPPRPYRMLGEIQEEWRYPGMDRVEMKRLAPVVKAQGGDATVYVKTQESEGETSYNVGVVKYL